jgi:NAD(P)H-dependent flavin oxidoreductase YrpB (nitropropane dioxygenase family)
MNGVSEHKLAIAIANAGCLPSLVPYTHYLKETADTYWSIFEQDLIEFRKVHPDYPVVVAVNLAEFVKDFFLDLCIKYRITHVEILDIEHNPHSEVVERIKVAKENGTETVFKVLDITSIDALVSKYGQIECVTVKGPNGAGRNTGIDLTNEVKAIREKYPKMIIIASGGINTSDDVKHFLTSGADGVCIGTIFTVSEEANISPVTKQKIIEANIDNLTQLETGAKQRSLVFSKVHELDYNNSKGNKLGIKTGTTGHIFLGTGVNVANKIRPVKEIVSDLVEKL